MKFDEKIERILNEDDRSNAIKYIRKLNKSSNIVVDKDVVEEIKEYSGEKVIIEGYVEVLGEEFDFALDEVVNAWDRWKEGPATEPNDIKPAKKEIIGYISSYLKKNMK